MKTKFITAAAEIPMKCASCGWTGNNAQCRALKLTQDWPGYIVSACPDCNKMAAQAEECEYTFTPMKDSRKDEKK